MSAQVFRAVLESDQRVYELIKTIGVPYWWGKGQPNTPWPPKACDCSGFVQQAWVWLGFFGSTQPDRNWKGLADICDPVKVTDARLGDIAIYVGHVMLCLGGEWVLGASGGDSNTKGNDPRAYVQLRRYDYRPDFATFGRLKSEFRL